MLFACYSLEDDAKKLHINLSKVIVYNCCPAVMSQGRLPHKGLCNVSIGIFQQIDTLANFKTFSTIS